MVQSIEIVFSRSVNDADNWKAEVPLGNSKNNYSPSTAVATDSTGKAYLLWSYHDFPGGAPGELYFVKEK